MLLRFIGDYTNGATQITLEGVTFTGREPSAVPAGSRLLRHPEFEKAEKAEIRPIKAENELSASPKPRGRPRK